jgi:hypothetical protein
VAQETRDIARDGEAIILQTVAKMQSIAAIVEQSAGLVNALGEQSTRITSIVNTIKEIADQTNLLASTRPSRRRAPRTAAASPWSPTKCASWPSGPASPPARSAR